MCEQRDEKREGTQVIECPRSRGEMTRLLLKEKEFRNLWDLQLAAQLAARGPERIVQNLCFRDAARNQIDGRERQCLLTQQCVSTMQKQRHRRFKTDVRQEHLS